MKNIKRNKDFFDFPNKVLSQPQLIPPFPNGIHQFMATFMELSYFLFVFPYRVTYNSAIGQYETRTNILHKIVFIIIWGLFLLQYTGLNLLRAMDTGRGDSLGILRLLGGAGHMVNILSFLFTVLYYRTKIVDLLNFLVIGGGTSMPLPPQKVASEDGIVKFQGKPQTPIYDNEGQSTVWKSITFRKLAIVFCFACLVMGIRTTTIIDRLTGNDEALIYLIEDRPSFYKFVEKITPQGFQSFMVSGWFPIRFAFVALAVAADKASEFHGFCAIFLYGLQFIVVLTLKFICSHFTNSLENSKEFWKPSSQNVGINCRYLMEGSPMRLY
ncbi:unnamed protein product [Orchesella dallaii]|uniref:Uncharacterized protein n=1 Tax=Orchesella dallaii TaxID=48710 RepID=A0ABP1R3C4_9HEXA